MKVAIKEILSQFYAEGVPSDVIARSHQFPEVRNNATVVMGMRRSGKTYFTYQRMRQLLDKGIPLERIVHLNFDDERLDGMSAADLHLVCDVHAEMFPDAHAQKCWYFLDELQDIKGWEKFARRLIDSHKVQLCLTGSSSRMLSSDIATEMRGRSEDVEIFPLSFAESLGYNAIFWEVPRLVDAPANKGRLKKAFAAYVHTGGFPDVQGVAEVSRVSRLQDYARAVVYRDIIERHEIPSVASLNYVMQYLLDNYARKVSVRAISGVLKQQGYPSSREAIANYLSYFADAYFCFPVSVRTDSLSVRKTNPDKYYLVDTGIASALRAKNDSEKGFVLENLVFLSLRRGFNKIEYYNTRSGNEVDFFVTDLESKVTRLVQVAYELSRDSTKDRELAALREAREETRVMDCTIVTWDDEYETEDGIKVVPAWKWAFSSGSDDADWR